MVDIGLTFLSAPTLFPGDNLGIKVTDLEFSENKKSFFFCLSLYSYIIKTPLGNFVYILHDGRYRSRVLLSMIPNPGYGLEVQATDFEFSCKSKKKKKKKKKKKNI